MNNQSPKISIIIPIYNVEKYLERCLDSIKSQSFENFEVIMVNDGSQDRSGEIAERYSNEDERFILIEQTNHGMSKSRNRGYSVCCGEYVVFLDSDDFIGSDYLKEMYTAAEKSNADVVMCNYAINYEYEGRIKHNKSRNIGAGDYTRDEAVTLLLNDRKVRFYVWNKLWKRDFLEKNCSEFLDIHYEDIVFCSYNFLRINKLTSIDYLGNFYTRYTKTFLEKTMTFKRIEDYILTVKYMREALEKDGSFEKFKKAFRVHASHVYLSIPILIVQANHSAEKKVKLFHTIKEYLKRVSYYAGKNFRLENNIQRDDSKICKKTQSQK